MKNIITLLLLILFMGSNDLKAQPLCPSPNNITVSNVSLTRATVSWQAVAGAVKYALEYKNDGNPNWTSIQNLTETSVNLGNLNPGVKYLVRVITNCSTGLKSVPSPQKEFTTPQCPPDPTFQMSNVTATTAHITWAAVSNSDSYQVSYSIKGSSNIQTATTSALFADLNNLKPNTTYVIMVKHTACFHYSNGLLAEFTTKSCPASSTAIYSISTTNTNAKVTWAAAVGETYKVSYRAVGGSSPWLSMTKTATTAEGFIEISGLTPNTVYECEVHPACNIQFTGSDKLKEFKTVPCASIKTIDASVNNITTTTARIFGTTINGESYQLQYRVKGTSAWTLLTRTANSVSLKMDIENLTPATTYEYALRPQCSVLYDFLKEFKTPSVNNCAPPTTPLVFQGDYIMPCCASDFQIHYRVKGTSVWQPNVIYFLPQQDPRLLGLTHGTVYEYQYSLRCSPTDFSAFSAIWTLTP